MIMVYVKVKYLLIIFITIHFLYYLKKINFLECNSLCKTCSNSNTCDLCKNELMFGESLCTVSIIGNFI